MEHSLRPDTVLGSGYKEGNIVSKTSRAFALLSPHSTVGDTGLKSSEVSHILL